MSEPRVTEVKVVRAFPGWRVRSVISDVPYLDPGTRLAYAIQGAGPYDPDTKTLPCSTRTFLLRRSAERRAAHLQVQYAAELAP